jgi:hypothetical protein
MFTSKAEARHWYNDILCKVKMIHYLKLANVSQSAFSRFMKSDVFNYSISLEKLNILYYTIIDDLHNLT